MVLQNRAGNLAKTETSAPFISDVKVECRCLTAQSKSSFFFFPDIKMISTLQQDFSRDNIGFTLPHPAYYASAVSVFKDYCSCNVKQVTITFAGTWKVGKISCQ